MNKKLIIIGAVLCVLIITSYLGNKTNRLAIGVITPLSGEAASMGEGVRNAIDLAVSEIDDSNFSVKYEDDQCDTKKAVLAYQKLKSEGVHVFYVACSGSVLALAPLAKEDNNLIITAYAGSSEIRKTGDEVIRFIPDSVTVVDAITEYFKESATTTALLYENTAYPLSVANSLKEKLAINLDLPYNATSRSLVLELLKIKQSNVSKIIFIPLSDKLANTIYKEMKTLGLKTSIVGDVNVCDYSSKPSDFGIPYVCFKAEASGERVENFKMKYKQRFGIESQYLFYDVATYDSIFGIYKTNGKKEEILKGVEGPTHSYLFDQKGELLNGYKYLKLVSSTN
jgi:branched-chain amino acid transport system substrate-binding protein